MRAVDQQFFFHTAFDEASAVDFQLETDHRPDAANFLDKVEFGRPLVHPFFGALFEERRFFEETLVFDHFDRRDPGRGGDRVPAERRGVHPATQARRQFFRRHHRARRDSAAERLGQRDHVRNDVEILIREPFSGAPHPRLHFVENEEHVVFIAKSAQPFEEARRRNADAAFALNRLDHNRRGFVVDRRFDRRQVAVRDVNETGKHRFQALLVLRLRGRGRGRHRASVEGVLEGDDLVFALRRRVEADELNRRFVRFGAGVAEERFAAEAAFGEHFRPNALLFLVPAVRDVQKTLDLFFQRFDDRFRTVPEEVATPTREKVEITNALGVPNVRPFAANERDRVTGVVRDDVFVEERNNFLRASGHCGLNFLNNLF